MSPSKTVISRPVLTVRVHAGLNAASLLAGLFAVGGMGLFSTANDLLKLRFPETQASLDVLPLSVNGIAGVTARFNAPAEGHVHRTPGDILHYYATASNLSEAALEVAHRIWHNVASAEARVHNSPLESVHFHEVGAIDSIVDIVSFSVLFDDLNPEKVYFSALTEGQGYVQCAHGILPVPVPAVCEIAAEYKLPVKITDNEGEMVTPTGAAIAAALYTGEKLPEEIIIEKVGYGRGKRPYKNPVLRVMKLK